MADAGRVMRLYLMRHGEAVPSAASDAARALTPRGREQVAGVARRRRAELLAVAAIVSSPILRARQTAAEIVRELGRSDEPGVSERLRPTAGIGDVGALISACGADSLLLVLHQPLVGATLAWLAAEAALATRGTADLAALELAAFAAGGARLRWLESGG